MPPQRDLAQEILNILGATGLIVPLGSRAFNWQGQAVGENDDATTVTAIKGASGINAVFTYQPGARTTWAAPTNYVGKYKIPLLSFNGSSEYLSSPDDSYWSGTADGTAPNEPAWSVGAWVYLRSLAANRALFAKFVETTGATQREVLLQISTTGGVFCTTFDESAGAFIGRGTASTIAVNRWYHIVLTKSTGVTNAAHVLYVDGVAVDNQNNTAGSYVARENTTGRVTLGMNDGASAPTRLFLGNMAGGALGPFHTQVVLTDVQIQNLVAIGREGLFSRYPSGLWVPGRHR